VAYRQPPGLLEILVSGVEAPALPAGRSALSQEVLLGQSPKLFYMWMAGREYLLSSADMQSALPR
jgi:hypothetical protein